MRVGYARVRENEVPDSENYAAILQTEKVFVDKYGERTQWQQLLLYVEENDVVVVQNVSELSAVNAELFEMIQVLAMKNVRLELLEEGVSTQNGEAGDIMTALLSLMGQVRGKNTDYYKLGGNYSSAKTLRKEMANVDFDRFEYLYPRFKAGEISRIECYKELGITRNEFNKLLEMYEQEKEEQ